MKALKYWFRFEFVEKPKNIQDNTKSGWKLRIGPFVIRHDEFGIRWVAFETYRTMKPLYERDK